MTTQKKSPTPKSEPKPVVFNYRVENGKLETREFNDHPYQNPSKHAWPCSSCGVTLIDPPETPPTGVGKGILLIPNYQMDDVESPRKIVKTLKTKAGLLTVITGHVNEK